MIDLNINYGLCDTGDTIEIAQDDGNKIYTYHSLSELFAEWEDYTPQEPLIKDEKARKSEPKVGDIIGVVRYGGKHKLTYYFDELCGEEE